MKKTNGQFSGICRHCGKKSEAKALKTETIELNEGMNNRVIPVYYFECPNCKHKIIVNN